ncbi:MAG: transglycosylase SLT domain-containing protein [Betaproteobacteria bacterium]|nr:transglycosylase SLT domain-containing protein [Betaproteobacteria bacterium]
MSVLLLGAVLSASAQAGAGTPESSPRQLVDQGVRWEHAEGVRRDLGAAHEAYCRAARAGSAEGLLRLGWMYANGRGVARDDALANGLFQRAAELGSDLGARLAGAITAAEPRLPACLTASMASEAVRPAVTASSGSETGAGAPATLMPPRPAESAPANQGLPSTAGAPGPAWRPLIAPALKLAAEFRLDPRLVLALIRAESNFDPQARSVRQAQGLMQLVPDTAERFAVRDAFDPLENLRGGMSYLRWLLSYFRGDVVLALAGYNAGEGAVDRHRGVPPHPETLAYVQRVRTLYPFDRHPFDPKAAAPMRAVWLADTAPGALR